MKTAYYIFIYIVGIILALVVIYASIFVIKTLINDRKKEKEKEKENKIKSDKDKHLRRERIYPVPIRYPLTKNENDDFSKVYSFLFESYNLDTIMEVYTIWHNTNLESNFGKDKAKEYFEWWAKEKIADLIINDKCESSFIAFPLSHILAMLTSNDGSYGIFTKGEMDVLLKELLEFETELKGNKGNKNIIKECSHHQERIYPVPIRQPQTEEEMDAYKDLCNQLEGMFFNTDNINLIWTIFTNTLYELNFGLDKAKEYFEWWAKEYIKDVIINKKYIPGLMLYSFILGLLTPKDYIGIYTQEEMDALTKELHEFETELLEKNKNQD